ncbi:MAG TPA: GNAT family N-acetyltransferase [Mycobacteriales bacterium]|nr:GNAT family N-acetyltransferase [Mycobacteriales bacterium]
MRTLRRDVLRPGGTLDPPPYDLDPATRHVGAFDDERTVLACVTIFPSPFVDEPLGWQLRGMAVDPVYQGRGIGRLVLDAAVELARSGGVPLLWANGRFNVLPFYERAGWTSIGAIFRYGPANLDHMVIVRRLSAVGRTVS